MATVSSNGGDIRVTTDAAVTLPREVVDINVGNETGELHLKSTALIEDNIFRIYYNGAEGSGYASTSKWSK